MVGKITYIKDRLDETYLKRGRERERERERERSKRVRGKIISLAFVVSMAVHGVHA